MAQLDAATLAVLIAGQTHVLARNGGEAYVYFGAGGDAHMLLDDGERRTGHWRLADGGYVSQWDNGTGATWELDYSPGSLTYVSRERNMRVPMIGILFGDAKGLAAADPRQGA